MRRSWEIQAYFATQALMLVAIGLCTMLGCEQKRPTRTTSDEIFSPAKIRDVAYVQQRLREGLDVTIRNDEPTNTDYLLTYAVRHGATETVRALLTAGADADIRSSGFSKTPLFQAAFDGYTAVAEVLIAHGADVSALDDSGNNPLREAILGNQPEMVALLLKAGSDPEQRNSYGESMAEIARRQDNPDIVAMFNADTPAAAPEN